MCYLCIQYHILPSFNMRLLTLFPIDLMLDSAIFGDKLLIFQQNSSKSPQTLMSAHPTMHCESEKVTVFLHAAHSGHDAI